MKHTADLVGMLLKQFLSGLGEVRKEIAQEFTKSKKLMGRSPSLREIENMLSAVLASFRQPFICIDAVDEFFAKERWDLFDSLVHLIQQSPGTRLFLTGHRHVRHEIKQHLDKRGAQIVSIGPTEEDIQRYITERLHKDRNNVAMSPQLRKDIIKSHRKARLETMKGGLDLRDVYNKTLNRIRDQDSSKSILGTKVLINKIR
ncbi:hypothetical protein L873DRAFT_1512193 [Choiromyces venosus 120613-1]|uniref:Nephrocystin 3-like N-terminal domain-containing protein n=1 Tax=Choiromyces venosus 120613-1 TaxID=1336337 RepID=A0A3N4J9H6_9PEZI|nr:hypothetical protein L873DRAFT_1512193 [Choiromyces venosus 120613-1]